MAHQGAILTFRGPACHWGANSGAFGKAGSRDRIIPPPTVRARSSVICDARPSKDRTTSAVNQISQEEIGNWGTMAEAINAELEAHYPQTDTRAVGS